MTAGDDLLGRLRSYVGKEAGAPRVAQEPVNRPMIRHWVEAMGDDNPVYLDTDAAAATGRNGIIAPPTMLAAWTMQGYASHHGNRSGATAAPGPMDELLALLDGAGFTGVVATNDEHEYVRELQPGDLLTMRSVIEDVSPEKRTGLGTGHFITTLRTYTDQNGEEVARQRFRILRYRPTAPSDQKPADQSTTGASGAQAAGDGAQRPLRPRPFITRDNAFWFEAVAQGRLVFQRCTSCGRLRHPPGPVCPHCHSFTWDTVTSSGRGTLYSFTVAHHPKVPAFDYPHAVGLAEMEEGVRLMADIVDIPHDQLRVGLPVQVRFTRHDEDLTLPQFGPREDGA